MKYKIIILLILNICMAYTLTGQQTKKTLISGTFINGRTDTLHLAFYQEKMGTTLAGAEYFDTITKNGSFCFSLPLSDHPAYITLVSGNNPRLYLDGYLLEKGDSIHILIDPDKTNGRYNIAQTGLSFTGRGAEKFTAKYDVESLGAKRDRELPIYRLGLPANLDTLILGFKDHFEPLRDFKLRVLDSLKKGISREIYSIMQADIYYQTEAARMQSMDIEWQMGFTYPDSLVRRKRISEYIKAEWNASTPYGILPALRYSKEYLTFLFRRALLIKKAEFQKRNLNAITDIIPVIESTDPLLQDRFTTGATAYMTSIMKNVKSLEAFLTYAQAKVQEPGLKNILNKCVEITRIGKPVFPFALTDIKGDPVKAADLKGKAVLLDFWFSGCMPCIELAKHLKELKKEVSGVSDIVFLSISADTDKQMWLNSVHSEKYGELENLHVYTSGNGFFNPLFQYYQITSCPRLMLIDANGNLVSANLTRPDTTEKIKELAKSLMHAAGK